MIAIRRGGPTYPARLNDLRHPPDPLWSSGQAVDWSRPAVAIVGTRRMSAYGARVAREVATVLARAGAIVVSGLAQGIDSEAHRATVEAGGCTVAVLGEGLAAFEASGPARRRRLAERIRERGAVVSEYALDLTADRWTFPRRNRTIAALAQTVMPPRWPRSWPRWSSSASSGRPGMDVSPAGERPSTLRRRHQGGWIAVRRMMRSPLPLLVVT